MPRRRPSTSAASPPARSDRWRRTATTTPPPRRAPRPARWQPPPRPVRVPPTSSAAQPDHSLPTTSFVSDAAGCVAVPITVAGAGLPVGATAGRAPGVRSECVGLTACPRRTSAPSLPEAMSMPVDGSTVGVTSTDGGVGTASAIGAGATSDVSLGAGATSDVSLGPAVVGAAALRAWFDVPPMSAACAPPELDTTAGATLRLLRDGGEESVSAADFRRTRRVAGEPADPVCGSDDFDAADPESGLDAPPRAMNPIRWARRRRCRHRWSALRRFRALPPTPRPGRCTRRDPYQRCPMTPEPAQTPWTPQAVDTPPDPHDVDLGCRQSLPSTHPAHDACPPQRPPADIQICSTINTTGDEKLYEHWGY